MKFLKVYLDTNAYCRPFDDQANSKIRKEAFAVQALLEQIESGKLDLITSDVLLFELNGVKDDNKKIKALTLVQLSSTHIGFSDETRSLAEMIQRRCPVGSMDLLHIASACQGSAHYFITCDDQILHQRQCIEQILARQGYETRIMNPIALNKLIAKN